MSLLFVYFFFFQAEDGIRDIGVTGVQTCALPISKDGKLVLTHDSNFKRIANIDKNVYDATLKEIKTYDVGSNFSPVFKGEKIPTLEEAIKLSKNKIKLNIEIKLNGHEKNLVTSVVNLIEKESFIDQCVVTSLDYDVLKEVRKLNPNIKIGYIMFVALGNLSSIDRKSTRLNSSHANISYAVFCLKKKKKS